MTEAELRAAILTRCDELELYYYYNSSWKTGRKAGWPDLVIIGHGMLHRELKSADGSVRLYQLDVGRRIKAAGGNWSVWRPCDLDSGRIEAELVELSECPFR
jgi:hypothetical protein